MNIYEMEKNPNVPNHQPDTKHRHQITNKFAIKSQISMILHRKPWFNDELIINPTLFYAQQRRKTHTAVLSLPSVCLPGGKLMISP
jgi:hypothetical protein